MCSLNCSFPTGVIYKINLSIFNYNGWQFHHGFYYLFVCLFIYLLLFRTVPMAYGISQSGGRIVATAAGLHHSHSNTDMSLICNLHHSSWLCQTTNPWSLNSHPHEYQLDSFLLCHNGSSASLICMLNLF